MSDALQLHDDGSPNQNDSLSARERQLLVMATNGLTDNGIAHELGISLATVSTYWGRVRIKFGPLPRTELVAQFVRGEMNRSTAALEASESRFRTLLEAATVGIVLTDPEGKIIYANHAYEQIIGRTMTELLEKGTQDLMHEDDREAVMAVWNRCLSEGTSYVSEHRYRKPDGRIAMVRSRGNAWMDGKKIGGRVSVVEDITAQHEAEQARLESEQRYLTLLSLAPEAIISVDEDLNIIEFNPGAERMFLYSPDEVMHQPLAMLLPEPYREGHEAHVKRFGSGTTATARPMASRSEVFGLRQNGESFRCEASIFRQTIRGRPLYTAILRDASQR